MESANCPNCGAPRGFGYFCEYCNSPLESVSSFAMGRECTLTVPTDCGMEVRVKFVPDSANMSDESEYMSYYADGDRVMTMCTNKCYRVSLSGVVTKIFQLPV